MFDYALHLYHGTRLALGTVFIVSAILKLADHNGFVTAVTSYQVLSKHNAKIYAYLVPWLELLAGALLLLDRWAPAGASLSGVLLTSFLIAVSLNLKRGRSLQCHCFGKLDSEPLSYKTVVRILVLLAAAGYVGAMGSALPRPAIDTTAMAATSAVVALGLVAYWSLRYANRILHSSREGR